jgi:hypothetical protein
MHRMSRHAIADAVFLAIALVWAGMLIGVSFVATPIKFSAPSLSLPVALDVGRVTFHLFSRIEWTLAATLLLTSAAGTSRVRTVLAVLLAALVTVQTVWLLPILDARIAAVVAGVPSPPSQHHTLYAIAEAIKLLLLAVAGSSSLSALAYRRT